MPVPRETLLASATLLLLACSRTAAPGPTARPSAPPIEPAPLDLAEDDSTPDITFEEIAYDGPTATCGGPASARVELTGLSGRASEATTRAAESQIRDLLTAPIEACETEGDSGIAYATLELKDGELRLAELIVSGPARLRGCIEWEFQEAVNFEGPSLPTVATLDVEIRLDVPYCPAPTPYQAASS